MSEGIRSVLDCPVRMLRIWISGDSIKGEPANPVYVETAVKTVCACLCKPTFSKYLITFYYSCLRRRGSGHFCTYVCTCMHSKQWRF